VVQLISGALVAGYLVAALFFLRFLRETGDRLFLAFAVAFAILAGQRTALALVPSSARSDTIIYGLRLLAFVLILLAIADKNRKNA
jgi:ABC-type thiamin/hydroxymethylpyrimidine transport system permease subunit